MKPKDTFVIFIIQFNCYLIFKPGQGKRQGEKEKAQRYKFVILINKFNCLIFKPGQGRRQGEKEEVQRCSAKGFRQRERRTQDGNQLGKCDGCPM